jgi:hypothetical protein
MSAPVSREISATPSLLTEGIARVPSLEASVMASRRLWAAMMLCLDWWTWESVVAGRPVRASNLDGGVLGHALRGARLPDADAYVQVTAAMLDAVAEHGPFDFERGR